MKIPKTTNFMISHKRGKGQEREYFGRYNEHEISISRESQKHDWYIRVYAPSGQLAYDGYWRNSAGKSIRKAVVEAVKGAHINLLGK